MGALYDKSKAQQQDSKPSTTGGGTLYQKGIQARNNGAFEAPTQQKKDADVEALKRGLGAEEPGLFQSIVQGVAKPFLKVGTTALNTLDSVQRLVKTGDTNAAASEMDKERDYGYFGKSNPLKTNGSTGEFAKDVVGTGAEIGSYAAGAGAAKTAVSGGVRAAAKGALEGAAAGALGSGGHAAQEEGSTAGSIAKDTAVGALVGGVVGGATGAISSKIAASRTAAALKKFDKEGQAIFDIVGPKVDKKATEEAIRFGRATESPITGKIEITPQKYDQDMVEATKGVLKGKKTPITQVQALNDEVARISEKEVLPYLEQHNRIFNVNTIKAKLNKIEMPLSFKSDPVLEKTYGNIRDVALQTIADNPKNMTGLLKARQEFDAQVRKEFPRMWDGSGKDTVVKQAIRDMRDTMNNFIAESLPEGQQEFSDKLYKQSLMFDAMDNIAEKASDTHGTNAIQRWFRAHPKTTKALEYGGAAAVGGSVLNKGINILRD